MDHAHFKLCAFIEYFQMVKKILIPYWDFIVGFVQPFLQSTV